MRRRLAQREEKVWALVARVLAFVLGAVVLVGGLVSLALVEERPFFVWVIVVALALMGPMFVASLATLLAAFSGRPPEEGEDD